MSDPGPQASPPDGATTSVALALDGTDNRLDDRVRTIWAISAAVPLLLLGIAGAIALAVATDVEFAVPLAAAGGVLLAALSAGWAVLQWSRWRWAAWDDALEMAHGVVFRRASLVPYHRIQQIDIRRSPLERAFHVATLEVHTAAATTDGQIPGVATEHAQELRRALLERAGIDDAA